MQNPSQLLKFTQVCMRLATEQVPPYSSKFSQHTFTQPQRVVLYCSFPGSPRGIYLAGSLSHVDRRKGYDDRSYRRWLRSRGKRPLIRHREFAPYDKAANARMDPQLYHRRSLGETVISVLKRTYGSAVRSRVGWRQFRE